MSTWSHLISLIWNRLSPLLPSLTQLGVGTLLGVLVATIGLTLTAGLRSHGVRAPDTRKLFHALVFTGAGVIQLQLGVGAVSAYGGVIACIVLFVVFRGEGFGPFEALARPTDAPRRGMFVVVPLVMTALGGLVANLIFPSTAMLGYWVTGWGDAIGEPVGVRWGRHRYRVPSLGGVPAERSWEGSAAVFVVSSVVSFIGLGVLAPTLSLTAIILKGIAIGSATVVVEAFSNHGTDNFTLQVATSGVAFWLLS
jgi:phytol kinase